MKNRGVVIAKNDLVFRLVFRLFSQNVLLRASFSFILPAPEEIKLLGHWRFLMD